MNFKNYVDEVNRRYQELATYLGCENGGPNGWGDHQYLMRILRCEIPDPRTGSYLTHVDLAAAEPRAGE